MWAQARELWGTQGVSWGRTEVQGYAGQFATMNLSVLQRALRENNLFFLLFPAIFRGGGGTEQRVASLCRLTPKKKKTDTQV